MCMYVSMYVCMYVKLDMQQKERYLNGICIYTWYSMIIEVKNIQTIVCILNNGTSAKF